MICRAASALQRGVSMVEVVIAASLLAIVGLAAVTMTNTSREGSQQARLESLHTGWLRRASLRLREDLEQTTASRLTIATLADQNHSITLQRPVAHGGGATTWGAYDPRKAGDERLRPGHFTRLTVVNGDAGRMLVRQVLDEDLNVVDEDVITRGLAGGSASPPGFCIVQSGDLWRVTIGLAGTTQRPGESLTFDVMLRN